jgi:nicotinamide-nucleotide amidase
MDFKNIVKKLAKEGLTISTMESCTGGGVANAITNIEGASDVFSSGAVTYSNEAKIKLGVSKKIIDEYSVYSMEVAHEMSKCISDYANSDIGIGVTGKLGRIDKNNLFGNNNTVYISIYDRRINKNYDYIVEALEETRKDNKQLIIDEIIKGLDKII